MKIKKMERKKNRKIEKGRVDIEERIEMKGIKKKEENGIIYGFMVNENERGLRNVMVIKGKGR